MPWQRIVSPLAMIVRGGVRHLQIWKCTASSERSCPETGSHCGKFHSGWFLPALCVPQERATALDELVVTSADGEHVAVRVRNTQDPRRASYLWALGKDVQRWRGLTGHSEGEPEDCRRMTSRSPTPNWSPPRTTARPYSTTFYKARMQAHVPGARLGSSGAGHCREIRRPPKSPGRNGRAAKRAANAQFRAGVDDDLHVRLGSIRT